MSINIGEWAKQQTYQTQFPAQRQQTLVKTPVKPEELTFQVYGESVTIYKKTEGTSACRTNGTSSSCRTNGTSSSCRTNGTATSNSEIKKTESAGKYCVLS